MESRDSHPRSDVPYQRLPEFEDRPEYHLTKEASFLAASTATDPPLIVDPVLSKVVRNGVRVQLFNPHHRQFLAANDTLAARDIDSTPSSADENRCWFALKSVGFNTFQIVTSKHGQVAVEPEAHNGVHAVHAHHLGLDGQVSTKLSTFDNVWNVKGSDVPPAQYQQPAVVHVEPPNTLFSLTREGAGLYSIHNKATWTYLCLRPTDGTLWPDHFRLVAVARSSSLYSTDYRSCLFAIRTSARAQQLVASAGSTDGDSESDDLGDTLMTPGCYLDLPPTTHHSDEHNRK